MASMAMVVAPSNAHKKCSQPQRSYLQEQGNTHAKVWRRTKIKEKKHVVRLLGT